MDASFSAFVFDTVWCPRTSENECLFADVSVSFVVSVPLCLCLCLSFLVPVFVWETFQHDRNKGDSLIGLCLYFLLPGQLLVSHFILSCSLPSQRFPPCAGGGFVHDLLLCFCPFPHGLLQFDHSVQFVHPPFTYNREWNICWIRRKYLLDLEITCR